jgi:DNA-binding response OmpR family regulator
MNPEENHAATVLLIEDEETEARLVQIAFNRIGLRNSMRWVASAEEALSYLSGQGIFSDRKLYPLPQLILLDLKMPSKSGFDVIPKVRKQKSFRDIPIIILSSSSYKPDIERALNLGADEYIVKPLDIRELENHLKDLKHKWLEHAVR